MKARFSALDGHSGIAYRPGVSTRIPLLLLPGLLNDARLWHHQTEALAGIAESRVPDISLDDSMAAIAARVLASAPERFALAGLSMGGYVCFEIMRQAPERVLRLALFDTSARPEAPEQERRRRGLMSLTSDADALSDEQTLVSVLRPGPSPRSSRNLPSRGASRGAARPGRSAHARPAG